MNLISKAAAFYERRQHESRSVLVFQPHGLPPQRTTHGQFLLTFLGLAIAITTAPGLLLVIAPLAAVFGYLIGGFFFPHPIRKVDQEVRWLDPDELDGLNPAALASYSTDLKSLCNNEHDAYSIDREVAEARRRQRKTVAAVALKTGTSRKTLNAWSQLEVREFARINALHRKLQARWLEYELDPQQRIDFPAMSDPSVPATARMIRALNAAGTAQNQSNLDQYKAAVKDFSSSLSAAEAAAKEGGESGAR